MSYTLGQAARATGKSKPTIARAIQSGKISAVRGEDGAYAIDPVELHRIYPMTGNSDGRLKQSVPADVPGEASEQRDARIVEQADTIRDLRETIRDLRARLDASETERRALLTDQRPVGRPWWRRIVGR